MMDLGGKKAMVVGLGASGIAAARFLADQGAEVIVNDQRDEAALGAAVEEARGLGADLVLGGHPSAAFSDRDLVVVSPGVPPLPVLEQVAARGIPVVSEVELASRFIDAPIVAVTGTNGKSTVTTLIGLMCERLGRPLFVGGNLGRPMIEAVGSEAAGRSGLVIVELSSFQLERVSEMRAHVAVLLNVTPDHLDRYPSFDAYAAAKARIFERQRAQDHAVLPAAEPELRALLRGAGSLSCFGAPGGTVRVDEGAIIDDDTSLRVPVESLRLRGTHNLSNACASALAARLAGADPESIEAALRAFGGLPHRMQLVGDVADVEYIDDSKATNVGAAVAAIDGLSPSTNKIVLIAGGVDKGGSYEPLVRRMRDEGRAVVAIGSAAPLIEKAFASAPLDLRLADTMDDAVHHAAALARPGDTVLLAPACASFDMFRSYAERGDVFQKAVRNLGGQP